MIATPTPRQPSRLNNTFKLQQPSSKPREYFDNESIMSSASEQSNGSGFRNNYAITRVNSNATLSWDVVRQERYKVSLKLSSKEIALLRYTWNKMLTEEHDVAEQSVLPFPGSAWAFSKDKPLPKVTSTNSTLNASSTFCIQIYSTLLSMNPDLEKLYPSLKHQAASMAGVLTLAINCLENLSSLDEYFMQLGKRHSRILGIEPAQFELMGEAFIQAFYSRFGKQFTHESEVLWVKFYMYLANSLLQFGIDPVIRQDRAFEDVSGLGSIYTSDFEVNSMAASSAVQSDYTEATSIMSSAASAHALFTKPAQKSVPVTPVAPSASSRTKEKISRKTRLLGKKKDCVIV